MHVIRISHFVDYIYERYRLTAKLTLTSEYSAETFEDEDW